MSKRRFFILGFFGIICIITLIYLVFLKVATYEVKFDCGKDCFIESQCIEKNNKVKKPESPSKKGYVFYEWQLDGNTYDFSSKVTKDIKLEAKWLPEKFVTVNIDTNSSQGTTSLEVLAGTSILDLIDTPVKEGYIFTGWYVDNKKYDLNKKVTSELNIEAKWEKNFSSLSIGDKVLIVGNYAESSTSIKAYHSRAIGWKRNVVNIYEGTEFPYAIGNEYGITGYFKINSLDRIS